jgi:hypothetical protein
MVLHMDNVDKLFKDRFSGHEMPVDPALWAAIEGQLLVSEATIDPVNELFRDRFQGHEVHVDPSVWTAIGQQLGHVPATPATSPWNWAAGAAAVLAVGAGLWWSISDRTTAVPERVPAVIAAPAEVRQGFEQVGGAAVQEPAASVGAALIAARVPTAAVTVPSSAVTVPIDGSGANADPQAPAAIPQEPDDAKAAVSEAIPADQVPERTMVAVFEEGGALQRDPQRVESIIREITERTVNEARAEAPPLQAQQAFGESVPEAPELFMPNTFTPNGDGVNDTYELPMVGFERMTVKVLSLTTDKLVFSSVNGEPWTGAGCEDGMYVVVVEAVSEDGRSLSKAKVVWLTRERMN